MFSGALDPQDQNVPSCYYIILIWQMGSTPRFCEFE